MIDNLTGSDLQPAIIGALIASGTALVVSVLTWLSTSRQVRVSRDTLFVSLLPRRHEWLDAFKAAVYARQAYISTIRSGNFTTVDGRLEPNIKIIHELSLSAIWLFDFTVKDQTKLIERELVNQVQAASRMNREFDETLESASAEALSLYATTVNNTRLLVADLVAACVPFLYVGDVKRRDSLPTRLQSTAKRLAKTIRSRFAPKTPPEN